MQDALSKLQNVISADVSLPDVATVKVRKDSISVDELTNVIKTVGFTATKK